jgi:hypothetical protein
VVAVDVAAVASIQLLFWLERVRLGAVDASRPPYVAEYSPDGRPGGRIDPSKHAIALSYGVPVDGEPQPQGEATGFEWFALDAIPSDDAFAFSHGR